jgi:hypothetical protein
MQNFFSGLTETVDSAENLAKHIIIQIKQWTDILKQREETEEILYLQACISRALLQMLRRGADFMIISLRKAVEIDATFSERDQEKVGLLPCGLSKASTAWRVWAVLGGAVNGIISKFTVEFEPKPQDERIACIEDL